MAPDNRDREVTLGCGFNHAFLTGMLSGLRATTVHAVLDPEGGECCVEITAD